MLPGVTLPKSPPPGGLFIVTRQAMIKSLFTTERTVLTKKRKRIVESSENWRQCQPVGKRGKAGSAHLR